MRNKPLYQVESKQGRSLTVEQIQHALREYEPIDYYVVGKPIKWASILVPLFCREDSWHVLFTRRTDFVNNHKGQVSFPGGAMEETDPDPLHTALRESFEEIGLKPEDVIVAGELGKVQSISGYLIYPYVGIIPWPYTFKIS